MAGDYFGGAPNAFLGGVEFGAAQRLRRQRENALASLIERYGPAAADPASLATLQAVEQSGQLHPYTIAQQEQAQQEAERVAAARQAEVGQYGVMAGDPAVQERDQALKLNAARRAAMVLQTVKKRNGDLSAAFDLVQNLLPAIGVPAENVAAIRERILTDPDSVDELVAFLQDPTKMAGGRAISGGTPVINPETGEYDIMYMTEAGPRFAGVAPVSAVQGAARIQQGATRLSQNARKLTNEELRMRGLEAPSGYEAWVDESTGVVSMAPVADTKQAQEFETTLREQDQADATYTRLAGLVEHRSRTVTENASKAIEYFSGARGGIILQNIRRGARLIPGTDMHEAFRALEAVRNSVATNELEDMRKSSANGASGFGQLTERELDLLQNARGVLQETRDPAELVRVLQQVQQDFSQIQAIIEADATAAQQRRTQRQQQYPGLRAPRAPGRTPQTPPGDEPAAAPATPISNMTQTQVRSMTNEELLRILTGGN